MWITKTWQAKRTLPVSTRRNARPRSENTGPAKTPKETGAKNNTSMSRSIFRLSPWPVLWAGLIAWVSACGPSPEYQASRGFPPQGWHKDSAAVFAVPIHDPDAPLDVYLEFRHNATYPYQNLWLFLTIHAPDGTAQQDSINAMLMDRHGYWTGEKKKNTFVHLLPYMPGVTFPDTGTYRMELRHGMRKTRLKGARQLKVIFMPHKK